MTTMIIGEAWGKEEAEMGKPFVGPSGRLLKGCMSQVGISYDECFVTNVFNFKPEPSNDISNLCGKKTEALPGWPALTKGKFVRAQYASELERLFKEILYVKPTLIIALGATASWALLKTTGIKSIRGAPIPYSVNSLSGNTFKVFPTYHPAAVLREWKLRPIFIADLYKARHEMDFPEIRRPAREIWIEPTLADLDTFEKQYILPAPKLSIDIENIGEQISCIGFAPTKDRALVVPFISKENKTGSYWATLDEELLALAWCKRMCGLDKAVVGQNILYDLNHLWSHYGITIPHIEEDTMLLHHALQPEMEKGLGFLGSIYTEEPPWKMMRKADTIKKED
jgi:uracil-DNA glycosylase